jgi:hypothetical protein
MAKTKFILIDCENVTTFPPAYVSALGHPRPREVGEVDGTQRAEDPLTTVTSGKGTNSELPN